MSYNVLRDSKKFHGWVVVVCCNYRVYSGPDLLNLSWRGPGRHLELTWRWSGPEFDNSAIWQLEENLISLNTCIGFRINLKFVKSSKYDLHLNSSHIACTLNNNSYSFFRNVHEINLFIKFTVSKPLRTDNFSLQYNTNFEVSDNAKITNYTNIWYCEYLH